MVGGIVTNAFSPYIKFIFITFIIVPIAKIYIISNFFRAYIRNIRDTFIPNIKTRAKYFINSNCLDFKIFNLLQGVFLRGEEPW